MHHEQYYLFIAVPYKKLQQRLSQLINTGQQQSLTGSYIGLEKESLRVAPDGTLAQTPHPRALGSALTNEFITTDYSEALIEFITPPLTNHRALKFLQDIHKFTYDRLGDEILWATSMPCVVQGESSIPIAQYGDSNLGMMKTVYRRGLGHRYGRMMQVIAGVHFNYSLPETFWQHFQDMEKNSDDAQDFQSDNYFAMIRNLQRYGWLIPYLFGASPAICKSFLENRKSTLVEFNETTYYEPFATSLRMGDIGYQNSREDNLGIKACYDNLESYVDCLTRAIESPCEEFKQFGLEVNGVYQQLNTNILQIENEYYSSVRPKQILQGNEKPTLALKKRGVRYIELRSLDINSYDPLGINEEQLYFIEAFLVFCLLQENPLISDKCRKEIDHNAMITAHQGRDPALELQNMGKTVRLQSWAAQILENMQGVCEVLDTANKTDKFTAALQNQATLINAPENTPSGRMIEEMRNNDEGFYHHAMRMSQKHHNYFKAVNIDSKQEKLLENSAVQSLESQQQLEAGDNMEFGEFLKAYFEQK